MMYIITHESHKLNQMCQRGIIVLQEQDLCIVIFNKLCGVFRSAFNMLEGGINSELSLPTEEGEYKRKIKRNRVVQPCPVATSSPQVAPKTHQAI
jgi:hypothetical protein